MNLHLHKRIKENKTIISLWSLFPVGPEAIYWHVHPKWGGIYIKSKNHVTLLLLVFAFRSFYDMIVVGMSFSCVFGSSLLVSNPWRLWGVPIIMCICLKWSFILIGYIYLSVMWFCVALGMDIKNDVCSKRLTKCSKYDYHSIFNNQHNWGRGSMTI